MASHWSRFVGGVTEKQAYALDKIAEANNMGNGMDLLMRLTGCNRSKVGKMDQFSLRRAIDRAFTEYGRPSS